MNGAGLFSVALFPSPKFHVHFTRLPEFGADASVNVIFLVAHAGAETLKFAVGNAFTITVLVAVVETQPTAEVIVSVTVYVPAANNS